MLTVHPRWRFRPLARGFWERAQAPLVLLAGVLTVYWKMVFTDQYPFLQFYDANQIIPWLQVQVWAMRHASLLLWDPYEWAGQSFVGQLQTGMFSPFKWLLAMAPLDPHGHIRLQSIYLWYVLLHFIAAWFAYALFRDLGLRKLAAVVGGLFYATAGFLGNTPWPQMVEAAMWAPVVFLFLLRSFRGRTPLRSAALAGVALGFSWCGGHHGPSLTLSLAAGGLCLWAILASAYKRQAMVRTAVLLVICGMVSAVQVLPALEYGKHSVRWTATGQKQWNDTIPYTEHETYGLAPAKLLNMILPGGSGLMGDPFTGVVALSLAVLAVWTDFRRREVRVFLALAAGALLFAMARSDVFYGLAYALIPFVGKSREPILALSVFQFGLAGLVAFGAQRLLVAPEPRVLAGIQRGLAWFGAGTFALLYAGVFFHPETETDTPAGMIALIALALAALLYASLKGFFRPSTVVILTGFLLLLEQGNETGARWMHRSDKAAVFLTPFAATQDLADFLRRQEKPFRVEMDRKELAMNFGDWNNLDAVVEYTPTVPADTVRLQWWQERTANLYGTVYSIGRAASRPGQREVFTGSTGLKIFQNPGAFPRAWTVHQIAMAPNEDRGAEMVREGDLDLRTHAVMAGETPPVQACVGADTVDAAVETSQRVSVGVDMGCAGMLVVSDNWYPGWTATVDGKSARIWKMDTTFRGVLVPGGRHDVVMKYRPGSVYAGMALALLGLAMTVVLQSRREADGVDLLNSATSASLL